ncbi:AraC family transcriptional regulator [Neobacillus mesonae]|nr:AraC family transcriptional regulator [Neobacillus mesonae]
MNYVESLQKAISYIEEHMLEEMSIAEVAKQAETSLYQFQRLFTFLTDISVGEYIRRRRLTLAAQDLSRTDSKVIDIALKYGYDTPEAFTKAFRRQHGITPSEARKPNSHLISYNRLIIHVSLRGADPMKYRIVEKEAFEVVGVHRNFSLSNGENLEMIPQMWNEVHENGINDRLFQLNNGEIDGVLGVCVSDEEQQKEQMMTYWIAADYKGEDVPEEMSKLIIPAAKWAVFEVHGPMPDAMQTVWKQIYSEWFPSSGYVQAGSIEFEYYTAQDASSPDCYSEIWIPVK